MPANPLAHGERGEGGGVGSSGLGKAALETSRLGGVLRLPQRARGSRSRSSKAGVNGLKLLDRVSSCGSPAGISRPGVKRLPDRVPSCASSTEESKASSASKIPASSCSAVVLASETPEQSRALSEVSPSARSRPAVSSSASGEFCLPPVRSHKARSKGIFSFFDLWAFLDSAHRLMRPRYVQATPSSLSTVATACAAVTCQNLCSLLAKVTASCSFCVSFWLIEPSPTSNSKDVMWIRMPWECNRLLGSYTNEH
mmetsp:Transcript_95982/g.222487  ORF Transcript_95982/g.222487 Transcript_95982/m.222487 type:complete len:255 (-) Transcript_95982:450-1214(-)